MGFKNDPKIAAYIEQAKILFKSVMVGVLALTAFGIGFIIMVLTALLVPILRWWRLRNIDNEVEVVKKGDYIEAEYEIIQDDKGEK